MEGEYISRTRKSPRSRSDRGPGEPGTCSLRLLSDHQAALCRPLQAQVAQWAGYSLARTTSFRRSNL